MLVSEIYKEICSVEKDISIFDLNQIFGLVLKSKPPFSHGKGEISSEDEEKIKSAVNRLKIGEPLQYILGEWEFYGLPFLVGEGVLIPRADTETLVDSALELIGDGAVAADFCSGTGAIAISLAKNSKLKKIYAVEYYDRAAYYLEKNIELNSASDVVEFIKADILNYVKLPPLDLLISNPPYIDGEEMKELPLNVRREPFTALYGGEDGLKFYRALSLRGHELLKENGILILEIGYRQALAVKEILEKDGYKNIRVIRDLTGNDRCIAAEV